MEVNRLSRLVGLHVGLDACLWEIRIRHPILARPGFGDLSRSLGRSKSIEIPCVNHPNQVAGGVSKTRGQLALR